MDSHIEHIIYRIWTVLFEYLKLKSLRNPSIIWNPEAFAPTHCLKMPMAYFIYSVTVTRYSAYSVSDKDARIVAEPAVIAVTVPFSSTVATASSLEV